MAGDWIPLRVDIADDPAVILMAGFLKTEEFSVVGRLHHLWSWANRQLESGNAPGVTLSWIDRYVGVSGFAEAMLKAGWLVQTDAGIEFPNFERWNSKSAKKRLLTAQRVKAHRNAHSNAPGVTKALPEKRREEKRVIPPLPPFPPELDNPEFQEAWGGWERHRAEKRKKITPSTRSLQIQKLAAMGPARAIAALRHSITQGYEGIFEPGANGNHRPAKPTLDELNARMAVKYGGAKAVQRD